MIKLNRHRQRLMKLMAKIGLGQILLLGTASLAYLIFIKPADYSVPLSLAIGCLVYFVSYTIYGFIYFRHQGAKDATKIVSSMIYGVLIKYASILGLSYIALSYLSINIPLFFIVLLFNHLIYIFLAVKI